MEFVDAPRGDSTLVRKAEVVNLLQNLGSVLGPLARKEHERVSAVDLSHASIFRYLSLRSYLHWRYLGYPIEYSHEYKIANLARLSLTMTTRKRKASQQLSKTDVPPKPVSTITRVIDPDGDICLILHHVDDSDSWSADLSDTSSDSSSDSSSDASVGSQTRVVFRVSRHVLCLSSTVFRAMLGKDSQFLEAGRDELELEDDDPRDMEIFLLVIHLQSHKIRLEVSFSRLYRFAVLCDKYDMSRSLGMFSAKWSEPHFKKEASFYNRKRQLFVGHAFKLNVSRLEDLVRYMVFQTNDLEDNGELGNNDEGMMLAPGIPQPILCTSCVLFKRLHTNRLQL